MDMVNINIKMEIYTKGDGSRTLKMISMPNLYSHQGPIIKEASKMENITEKEFLKLQMAYIIKEAS